MPAPATGVDRRCGYIRGLFKLASASSRAAHREKEWEYMCIWIAKLALEDGPEPLSSRHAASRINGFGAKALEVLVQIEEGLPPPNYKQPGRGTFCSAAAAILVTLLEWCEHVEVTANATKDAHLCSLPDLLEGARGRCEQPFRPVEEHYAAARDGLKIKCAAFRQMHELITRGFVKQRARDGAAVYELLSAGRTRALALRDSGEARDVAPVRSYRRVQPGERGVVLLLVDCREGGGQSRAQFWELCDHLERVGVRYETRALPTGGGDVWRATHRSTSFPCTPSLHFTPAPLLLVRRRLSFRGRRRTAANGEHCAPATGS